MNDGFGKILLGGTRRVIKALGLSPDKYAVDVKGNFE
jgi:hypothetical protein